MTPHDKQQPAVDAESRAADSDDIDPRLDSPGREGLTGKTSSEVYAPFRDAAEITTGPDGAPLSCQPAWRRDFPIDWPEDQFVARRDFTKFLVLTSGAFVAGQAWIGLQDLLQGTRSAMPRLKIATLTDLPVGTARVFGYPTEHEPCLLIRVDEGTLVAYSQACTHLSCAVVPRVAEGVLHCPCHEGYFDLLTGKNIAGPPPRPLPRIDLELDGDAVYAVGVTKRTV